MSFAVFLKRQPSNPRLHLGMLSGLAALCFAPVSALAATPVAIPMNAKQWKITGPVSFEAPSDLRGAAMVVPEKGSAALQGAEFSDGTIEFDVKPKNGGIEGIKFRTVGRETADAFYFRAQARCDESNDCIQYMAYHHGAYEWDLYPEYQTHATLLPDAWNHVKLVISGRRMNAYLNGASSPTIAVGELEGDASKGGICLSGPAAYANFTISSSVDHLSRGPTRDSTDTDPNFIRDWRTSGPIIIRTLRDPVYKVPTGVAPTYNQLPPSSATWKVVRAEKKGLINLSRAYGSSKDGAVVSMIWLKASVVSDRLQVKSVSMGWLREAWVFVNGHQVFADRNLYGTPASKGPDGSISLRNGSFNLPLQKGENTIVVALDDNFSGGHHFGWGMQFHLDNASGLKVGSS
jgi:hypothetical protein